VGRSGGREHFDAVERRRSGKKESRNHKAVFSPDRFPLYQISPDTRPGIFQFIRIVGQNLKRTFRAVIIHSIRAPCAYLRGRCVMS